MSEPKTVDEKLDDILAILNGNGKIGVCAKVEIMWGTAVFLICAVTIQAIILTRILMT